MVGRLSYSKRALRSSDPAGLPIGRVLTVCWVISVLYAVDFWSRWAEAWHLPALSGPAAMVYVLLAILTASAFQECGHATVALLLGMKLFRFSVGPMQWRIQDGRWTFAFSATGVTSLGGSVIAAPTNLKQPRWQDLAMLAAGPATTCAAGAVALWVALRPETRAHTGGWEFMALLGILCLILATLDLVPIHSGGEAYSDGARILQAMWRAPSSEFIRITRRMISTLVTSLRPMDIDVDKVEKAARRFSNDSRGLTLYLCATQALEDAGRIPEARLTLAAAERVFAKRSVEVPVSLYTTFVYSHAYLNRNAGAARTWWDRMADTKPETVNVDYWIARCALLWIEGRLDEADKAWERADAEAHALPQFGAYDFDRARCVVLRRELDHARGPEEHVGVRAERRMLRRGMKPHSAFGTAAMEAILG